MCRDDIKVTFEIPINKVDKNNMIYSKETIEESIKTFKERKLKDIPLPITNRFDIDNITILGEVTDMEIVDEVLKVTGVIKEGGTIGIGENDGTNEEGFQPIKNFSIHSVSMYSHEVIKAEKLFPGIFLPTPCIILDDIKEEE